MAVIGRKEMRRMISLITSVQNQQVKEWKKLHRKKFRDKSKTFLIEGYHLIEAAYQTEQDVRTVIVEEGKEAPAWMDQDHLVYVTTQVFKEIAQTETPQGIIAVVKMAPLPQQNDQYVLLLDAIQDPGNLGTIIRTADAAGFSKIILGNGTVDMYNDKVIRASQGSIFHIPIEQADLTQAIPSLQTAGYEVWATTLARAQNYATLRPAKKTAILLGNEGSGVDDTLLELADALVKIPIYGKAESLNVSIAAAILMYHLRK